MYLCAIAQNTGGLRAFFFHRFARAFSTISKRWFITLYQRFCDVWISKSPDDLADFCEFPRTAGCRGANVRKGAHVHAQPAGTCKREGANETK